MAGQLEADCEQMGAAGMRALCEAVRGSVERGTTAGLLDQLAAEFALVRSLQQDWIKGLENK